MVEYRREVIGRSRRASCVVACSHDESTREEIWEKRRPSRVNEDTLKGTGSTNQPSLVGTPFSGCHKDDLSRYRGTGLLALVGTESTQRLAFCRCKLCPPRNRSAQHDGVGICAGSHTCQPESRADLAHAFNSSKNANSFTASQRSDSVVSLRLPVRLLSIMVYLYSYLPNGNGSHVDAVQYSAFGLTADTAEPRGAKSYADAH